MQRQARGLQTINAPSLDNALTLQVAEGSFTFAPVEGKLVTFNAHMHDCDLCHATSWQVAEGGFAFAFVEGKLVTALREGWWLLLDEINLVRMFFVFLFEVYGCGAREL